ncbi:ATP-binding protein [Kitasatospora sp. NPDC006697]|uniref:ATP-binding protein n=1 Tax=Kitasatospora sp. NPDC006697 TaxID=3364020 RepID=UPI00368FDFB0
MKANGATLDDNQAEADTVGVSGGQLRRLMLAGVPKPVSRAKAFTAQALADWSEPGYAGEAAQDVLLLVAELVANAVMHAGGPLELALRASEGTLRVEVSDSSPVLPAAREPHLPGVPGGHGLFIVQRTARRWGAEPHGRGKTVWAETAVPGAAAHG